MNERKNGKHYKKQKTEYELMFFEEIDYIFDDESKKVFEDVFNDDDLRYTLHIENLDIYLKTDKGYYVNCNCIDDEENKVVDYELPLFIPSEKIDDVIILRLPKGYSERVYYGLSKEECHKLLNLHKTIQYLKKVYEVAEDKLNNLREKYNLDYYYRRDLDRLDDFLEKFNLKNYSQRTIDYINGLTNDDMIKDEFRQKLLLELKDFLKKIERHLNDKEKEKQEEKEIQDFSNTRKLTNDYLEFDDTKITLKYDEEFEIDLIKKHDVNNGKVILRDEFDEDTDTQFINLNYIQSRDSFFEYCIVPLNITKNGYTIIKNTNRFEVTFVNGRCKVNDVSINKQYLTKVLKMWLKNQSIDIEETIKTYRLLGVRKQLIVDNLNHVEISNVGIQQKKVKVNVTITPEDKEFAKLNIFNQDVLVEWEKLLTIYISGNNFYNRYIGLSDLLDFGLNKSDVLKRLKNLTLLQDI